MNKETIIEIRPYLLKELAEIYGVHRQTMAIWLSRIKDQIGEKAGYYYSVTQVREIFRLLSLPSTVRLSDHFEDIWDSEKKT